MAVPMDLPTTTDEVPVTKRDAAFLEVLRQLFEEYPADEEIPKQKHHGNTAAYYRARAIVRVCEGALDIAVGLARDTGVPNELIDAAYALIYR